jgi:thiol-disulfide isomerase/thioredoxin
MKSITITLLILLGGCIFVKETSFSTKALNDVFITQKETSITFEEILAKHKGKKILINIWASWCGDCLNSIPGTKKLQRKFPEVVFLNLSLDRTIAEWKTGIQKYKPNQEHYYMKSGWKGDFGSFLRLNWIPRYLIVNEKGEITLYNATKSTDTEIEKNLKK